MAVSIESDDAVINGVNLTVQGSDLTTPASGHAILYAKSGHLYIRLDDGTVIDVGPPAAGAIATDTLWDAAGDLAVGTGANTAAKLSMGTAYQVPQVNSGATALAYGPTATDWTPVVKQGANTPTLGSYTCKAIRIGPLVYIYASIPITGSGEAGQSIHVEGLPHAPSIVTATCIGQYLAFDSGTTYYCGTVVWNSGSPAYVVFRTNASPSDLGYSPGWTLANGDRIDFTLAYFV